MGDQRAGTRIPLKTRVMIRYDVEDDQRAFKFPVNDLDANAVSLTIPTTHSINHDFHHIHGDTVSIEFHHDTAHSTRRIEGFLYRVERLDTDNARWVFSFSQKIDPERVAEQIEDH